MGVAKSFRDFDSLSTSEKAVVEIWIMWRVDNQSLLTSHLSLLTHE
jgi:hypothetical protein